MQQPKYPTRKPATRYPRNKMEGFRPVQAIVALAALAAVVLGFIMQYKWFPDGLVTRATNAQTVSEIAASTSVQINEVMSSNGSAWSDENGEFGDWVEVYNSSATETVDITGWMLADSTTSPTMFKFPAQQLAPGEFVIVFCDGTQRSTPGYTYHSPFKISSNGDNVLLINATGTVVQSVSVPALDRNQSYSKTGSGWAITAAYTPGMPNEQQYYDQMRAYLADGTSLSDLVITEIMADNATYIPDEDGLYCDWIEIHNAGASAARLSGWCLSDDPSNPTKWRFPDISLGAGEYMIVYASGKDRATAGANLHTSFKLNAEGETVVLSNAEGVAQCSVRFSVLKVDRSLSLTEGSYTDGLAPTPGAANTTVSAAALTEQMAAANISGVYINEVYTGESRTTDTKGTSQKWVELYNSTARTVDLSGWGLSDEPDEPRKWQFAGGATIGAGAYLTVYLTGTDAQDPAKGQYSASFSVTQAADGGETLTLCAPDGKVLDRMPLIRQYASISYGRISGQSGFFYLGKSTPGAANSSTGYASRVSEVRFSANGGLYDEPVMVELYAADGCVIRYTVDGSEPTTDSAVYNGPLQVMQTTVLRARAWNDNEMRSTVSTQTYFIGLNHTVNVMSVVLDPEDLWSSTKGLYVMGPNALAASPYGSIDRGANFWMTWEKSAHIEYYDIDGKTILSQGCGLAMHGQYSRAEPQKAFRMIARYEYDADNRFRASLFSMRDYTEYQSFILRASGSDGDKTRMRDSILTSLAENTEVMYQDTEIVVVYLNGQYWGQYNMRERINKHSIAQWEGWTNVDDISIVKANTNVLQGSNDTFAEMLAWIKANGVKSDKALEYVASVIDIDNYIDYICLEMFTGNTDTLNVKRYRSDSEGDGKWRWIFFDLDWAFYTNTNSIARWIDPEGMGTDKRTDNTLFVELMKNATFRDRFLTRLGELMATDFTTRNIVDKVNERIRILMPEMDAHFAKWNGYSVSGEKTSTFSMSKWKKELESFIDYAETRPELLLYYIQEKSLGLSDAEMQKYFGGAMAAIEAYKNGL